MADTLIVRRTEQNMLAPTDAIGAEALRRIPYGEEVKAVISCPRNVKHHRMFFALLNLVFDAQDTYPTLDGLLDAIKVALGHCDEMRTLDGKLFLVPRSISFASMDQTQFSQLFDRAIDLIITHILPHTSKADLEQRVFDILGEPGPSALERYRA